MNFIRTNTFIRLVSLSTYRYDSSIISSNNRVSRKIKTKMLNTDVSSSICQSFRIILLIFHAIIMVHLLYEIIYSIEDEMNNELFNSILSGLTAIISFSSYAFYVWHYNAIRSTCSKLQKIDHSFKLIGVKPSVESNLSSKSIKLVVYVILLAVYFYTKYLRNLYSNVGLSMVMVWKGTIVRTYFLASSAFVMLSFVNKVHRGKLKFKALNEYMENLVENDKNDLGAQDIDDINNVYLQIVEYCDTIRNLYQVQIFLTSMSDMFTIIYMLLTVFNEFVSRLVTTAAIIFCIVDPLYRIVQTIVVINAAVVTTRQARQMADYLQRLMIETLLDTMMKEKIRLFLMEMVDKKLIFIVSGFLTLNYETLVAMMGTISTYLLIMMQFRPPGDTTMDDNNSVEDDN